MHVSKQYYVSLVPSSLAPLCLLLFCSIDLMLDAGSFKDMISDLFRDVTISKDPHDSGTKYALNDSTLESFDSMLVIN